MASARLSTRSASEWIVRGLLAAVALAAGYVGAVRSLGYMLDNRDPASAHALVPDDGRITALLAQKLGGVTASNADRARGNTLARQALLQDPTAIPAALTLGFNAQLRGDNPRARRLLAYSQTLSRRNLETQLWAIEDAVARNDIKGALRHYDIALRTSPSVGNLLFPVLAQAAADPTIRTELVAVLSRRPAWSDAFINRVAAGATSASSAANLFTALGVAGVPMPDGARSAVIGGLIKAGAIDDAWTYYASIRPGVRRDRSRDPRFVANLSVPSPFDWTPIAQDGRVTTIQSGTVEFTAPASVGGPLVQQLQVLPAGNYRIDGRTEGIDQAKDARPYWVLACWEGRDLGRVVVPNSAQAGGDFIGTFSVPADCPVQMLTLVARPSDTIGGLSGQIDRVQLAPTR